MVRNATAWALFSLGEYDEAQAEAQRLVESHRADAHIRGEAFALRLLACVALALGKFAEALNAATEYQRLVSFVGIADDYFVARMLVARCRARLSEPGALEDLRAIVGEASQRKDDDSEGILSRLFLAESLWPTDRSTASALFNEVKEQAGRTPNAWVQAELRAFERTIQREPIRVEDDCLILDARTTWPAMRDAREAVERYLYDRAMEETGGNAAAAGRLIGLSRYEMMTLGRILRGEAPRRSRSKKAEDEDPKPERRRPSRRS
jgi:hypothetical protein